MRIPLPAMILGALVLATLDTTVFAAEANESYSYGIKVGAESFTWEEYDGDGDRLLKEDGPRFTLSAFIGNAMLVDQGLFYGLEGRFYYGEVDYDGQTQSGVPATADTEYTGALVEGGIGYRIPLTPQVGVDLMVGLGLDAWEREIQEGETNMGAPVLGLTERYRILYGKLGAGPFMRWKRWRGQLLAGVKYPWDTHEHVDLTAVGFDSDVVLSPDEEPSAFVSFSNQIELARRYDLRVDLYYDSYRFGESDPEVVTSGGTAFNVFQPESDMDVYGVQLGLSF